MKIFYHEIPPFVLVNTFPPFDFINERFHLRKKIKLTSLLCIVYCKKKKKPISKCSKHQSPVKAQCWQDDPPKCSNQWPPSLSCESPDLKIMWLALYQLQIPLVYLSYIVKTLCKITRVKRATEEVDWIP